jgi:hypothetical protein
MNPHVEKCHRALVAVHDASRTMRSKDGETCEQWTQRRMKLCAEMLADILFPQKGQDAQGK